MRVCLMKSESLLLATMVLCGLSATLPAADAVFSGPQPGEKTSPFKVVELTGPNADKERNPIAENAGKPTSLVFVHGIERSLGALLVCRRIKADPAACPELSVVLGDWDGTFTVLILPFFL